MDLREYNMIKPLAEELMMLSEKNNFQYGITISDYFLSAYYLNIDNYSTSIEYLTNAYSRVYDLEDNEDKSILMLRIHLALSAYYHRISMLPQALEHIHKAMEINDSLNIFRYKVIVVNNFAGIYADIDNPEKGITLLKPLLKEEKLTKQHDFLINLNIGVLYSRENKTDSALIYFNNAKKSVNTNKDEMTLLYMIGNSYSQKGDIDTALDYLHKGISVENALSNPDTYALCVIKIAALYSQMRETDSALYYIDKVIDSTSALSLKCNGLFIKANILKQAGKYEECIDVLNEYIILNDSINNIKNVSKTSQMIFDYEKKQELMRAEIDNYILQAEYSKEKNRLIILTISSLMGVIIVLLLFSRNKIILKNKKESEAALKDQLELRNKELTTKVMLQLQKNEVVEEIIKIITDIDKNEENKHNLKQITKKLRHLKASSSWSDFDYGFIKIHQNFYDKLLNDFPDLTLSERRLCALIKLNLNTKEIASITNLGPDSVRVARTRLRKKLNLTHSDMPLSTFFANYS
jgi:tetratricopeptide (TPR) repeat protein